MLMHAIAHRGCTNIVRKAALNTDSGEMSLEAVGSETSISIAPGFYCAATGPQ